MLKINDKYKLIGEECLKDILEHFHLGTIDVLLEEYCKDNGLEFPDDGIPYNELIIKNINNPCFILPKNVDVVNELSVLSKMFENDFKKIKSFEVEYIDFGVFYLSPNSELMVLSLEEYLSIELDKKFVDVSLDDQRKLRLESKTWDVYLLKT